LEERTARANAAGADLFISLHVNASDNPEVRGIETYYLNNSNDRATIRLAALENGLQHVASTAPQQTGLSYILSDLIQTGKEEESISLANHLQYALVSRAKKRNPHVRNIGVKKGPFYVLVGAHMPCVLVEAGFITNKAERRLLLSKTYQEDLAEGLYQGIAKFLREQEQAKSL
jgi:N-acetylmuramoyl-L-alanine amidase